MAINVNTVYRTVLSLLNREQRGFMTPDQYNRFARMAQLDLFEKSLISKKYLLTLETISLPFSQFFHLQRCENVSEELLARHHYQYLLKHGNLCP